MEQILCLLLHVSQKLQLVQLQGVLYKYYTSLLPLKVSIRTGAHKVCLSLMLSGINHFSPSEAFFKNFAFIQLQN